MSCLLKYLLTALLLCLHTAGASAQGVWPGDVNNSGSVNGADFLFWGLAFGQNGSVRSNADTDWEEQALPTLWPGSFPNGLNFAFADANGDGVVNFADVEEAIDENFGLSHSPLAAPEYNNAPAGSSGLRLRFIPNKSVVRPGETLEVEVILGDESDPVTEFHGFSCKIAYESSLVDDELEFQRSNTPWYANDGNSVFDFIHDDEAGNAEFAVTRTGGQSISGNGSLGKISIVIEDIIVGLQVDTFRLRADSLLLLNENMQSTAVIPDTMFVLVANPDARNAVPLYVAPNPSRGKAAVCLNENIIQWSLHDTVGKSMAATLKPGANGCYELDMANLPCGCYFLSIQTPVGWARQQIIRLN